MRSLRKGLRRHPPSHRRRHCGKKCASPYIGERFGENSVGGKWLMGAGLRIPLTLLARGQGAFGGEIILLNCCKWLQINGPFFRLLLIYPRAERGSIGGHRGGRGTGERVARNSSFILHPSSFEPSLPGCGAKRPYRPSGLRRGCRSARPKGPGPCSLIWHRAKTNAKPQEPPNHAPSSNSNLRLDPFQQGCIKLGSANARAFEFLPTTGLA
jgi:hypothetical protein